MTIEKNKPAETLHDGRIKAVIWKNSGQNGTYYSVTVSKTFKDGDSYRDTSSLIGAENLQAAQLRQKAYERTVQLQAADRKATDVEEQPELPA